jgi:hypothetical protein
MLVTAPETDADELLRLPGLFRRWELEQIVEAGGTTGSRMPAPPTTEPHYSPFIGASLMG